MLLLVIAFENEYQGVKISLSKVMENDELFGIYGNDYYTSVRFGLFAAEDITAADGSVIPADGLISEVSLDENMTAKFDVQIPFGRYYVQEIATDEHWFCQYHLTHFIRTRIMQRERYDHSRAFFELPEAAHRWRCRFFC